MKGYPMYKHRKMLVAFDGSDSSKNALVQALRLAKAKGCWVKVLSVVPHYEGDLDLTGVRDMSRVFAGPAEKLTAEAEAIAKQEGVNILTDVEQGKAYEKIVDVAEAESCTLIVMGRKGHSRIEKALMGSVTARVIGHSRIDVLVVPRDGTVGWGKVLLPTDGSKYSGAAATKAIDIASENSGTLSALYVVFLNDELQANAPDVVERLKANARVVLSGISEEGATKGVKVETVVRECRGGEEIYEKITDYARSSGTELIVMGSHGRTGLRRLLMGSVTEKVIGYASCPVLVVRL